MSVKRDRELAEKATPGPWWLMEKNAVFSPDEDVLVALPPGGPFENPEDMQHIANMDPARTLRYIEFVEAFDATERFPAGHMTEEQGLAFEEAWDRLREARAALDHNESSLRGKDGRTDEGADDGR